SRREAQGRGGGVRRTGGEGEVRSHRDRHDGRARDRGPVGAEGGRGDRDRPVQDPARAEGRLVRARRQHAAQGGPERAIVSLLEILRVAVATLRAHKLRTFLTLLGVILGVMTVVAVVSVISGLNAYVRESFAMLTPELFIVSKFGIITSREEFLEARRRKDLTAEDLEAIARECRECSMVG